MAEDRVKSKDVEVEVIDERMNQVLQRDSALEMEMLELFEDITLEDVVINKACVGKVVGCKDMPTSIVKKILLGVWRRLGPWRMKKCEDGVMGFFFEEEDDCAFVLEKRPWLVNGVLLNLKPWPVEGEVRVAEFEVASFWVQFHGLPTRFLKDENAAIMGKKVGSFLKTDSKPKEELGKGITKLIVDNGEVPEWELNGKHRRGVWRRRQPPRAITTKAGSGLEVGVTQENVAAPAGHFRQAGNIIRIKDKSYAGSTSSGGAARYPGDRIEGGWVIPNIGPTIAQSLEIPHEWVCLSQTPHKFPKPTPLGWPNLDKEGQEMFLKLYVDDVINLCKAQQSLISNPPNLSEMILFLLGNTRKRKVHTWYEPYPADSLASSSNKTASEETAKTQWTPTKEKFCIGSGGEASNPGKATTRGRKPKGKEDNRSAKRSSGVKLRTGRRRGRDAGDTADLDNNNEVLNNCIEVNIEYGSIQNFGSDEKAAGSMPPPSSWDFLFLSETKVTVETMGTVFNRLGFVNHWCIPANGLAGGFCIAWRIGVLCNVVDTYETGFLVSFQAAIGFPEWKMYCIYGTPYGASKREFWSWLTENIGGRDYDAREGEFLRNFLFKCGGIDLGSVGGIFTWQNSRLAPNRIQKRLDRVIADGDWCTVFSNARVQNYPITGSDHAPILLDTWGDTLKLNYPFRFLEREMGLPRKFCRTKRELKLWNQNVFGFFDRKLRCLRNQLESVQKMAITQSTVAKEAEIQMEILDMEEKMGRIWRQKSRENWLWFSDGNSKFFHMSTLIRRRRNFISGMTRGNG
ncbi:hypothetical protein G4B88_026709 [Cannabis sativa]|uniref:DUF4283 domain-containing protein n=1 Tax=Cannabis sativa TaxID=3483 RepID=A0A7J6DUR1_CANSA|nr:hypothetical protein G4B88_026709 [Cannabis sativa]